MHQHRKTGLVFIGLLLISFCISLVWAKSVVIVGMVTETQGLAYWQNDGKKNRLQELAELPENAKLVLTQGSKMTLVYLTTGQQFELSGPALVQFNHARPVALNGMAPKTVGAPPVLTEKTRIDPKKVQTAGQTLVSTEEKQDPNSAVAVAAAPPPPPPPPPAAAPMPAASAAMPIISVEAIAAAEEREKMEAYEAAKRSAEAAAMASRAKTEESAARRAEIEAADAARRTAEQKSKAEQDGCQPVETDDKNGSEQASQKTVEAQAVAKDCPMITF